MSQAVMPRALRFDRFVLDLARGCLRAGDHDVELRPKCPFRNFLNRLNQLDFKGGGLIRGGVADVDA